MSRSRTSVGDQRVGSDAVEEDGGLTKEFVEVRRKQGIKDYQKLRRQVKLKLSTRATQIVPYEALAVLQALSTWRHRLVGRQVVLFTDNSSVLGCVQKGRSRAEDVHEIISLTLSLLEQSHIKLYSFWVPSSLNIADVPSRGMSLPFGTEVRCR